MAFTQEHFEFVAALIRDSEEHFKSNKAHAEFAKKAARRLGSTNPRFDFKRFISASMPRWLVGARGEIAWNKVSRELIEENKEGV